MSESLPNIEQQKRVGHVLLVSAVLIVVGGVAVFQYYGFPPIGYLGLLVPAGILLGFGYRNVSAAREAQAITDERREQLVDKTGNIAFWWLISLITFDSFFELTPDDGVRGAYLALGLVSLGIGYVSVRYIDPAISDRWKTN